MILITMTIHKHLKNNQNIRFMKGDKKIWKKIKNPPLPTMGEKQPTNRNIIPTIVVHFYILTHSGVVGNRTVRFLASLTDLTIIGR